MLISSENAAKKRLAFDTSLKKYLFMFQLENKATRMVFDWEEILANWPFLSDKHVSMPGK
jgi:hypothetical protein